MSEYANTQGLVRANYAMQTAGACRPADVFQEWFLHLGTAKLKKNI